MAGAAIHPRPPGRAGSVPMLCKTYALAAFAAMLALGGCGLKGPLYMPPQDPAPAAQPRQPSSGQGDAAVKAADDNGDAAKSTAADGGATKDAQDGAAASGSN